MLKTPNQKHYKHSYFSYRVPKILIIQSGPPREFLAPRAKGSVTPSSNSPNNDTRTKSTTVCHKQGRIRTTKMN